MRIKLLFVLCAFFCNLSANYYAHDGWIVGYHKDRYNNRPLYLSKPNTFILTGDNPLIRFVSEQYLYGTIYFTFLTNNQKKDLHNFSNIKSMYRGGIMRWELSDEEIPGLNITVQIIPSMSDVLGSVIFLDVKGGKVTDKLLLNYGEKKNLGQKLSWRLDVLGHPDILQWGIDDDFVIEKELILDSPTQYLRVLMTDDKSLSIIRDNYRYYDECLKETEDFLSRVKINTPDEFLNSISTASIKAVDGTWSEPVFLHGCMQWNSRLPGWRTMFGGTMYGWHDRIFKEAKFYIDSQIKESDKDSAKYDEKYLLTKQHPDSRFYGQGRIARDQSFYNMQTQFFDQLVEEYRWNNSQDFVALLRPALELHLKWQQECFDPDEDGVYESYINTWPTDSQWYNGGGTAEETSYAYRGHKAAFDMAVNEGDSVSAKYHETIIERIENGFHKKLWIKSHGHSGSYIEQCGYNRVHKNPWMYSIFLPVDAGLTSIMQNIESMYYTEWALQNDSLDINERVVWTSNWIPAVWSVRELWPGDNYHLAYAYFKSGLSDDAWKIMKGTFMKTGFKHNVPGNLGGEQGGIDFGDCVHVFARTLVSGLFGYMPDYPKNRVVFEPSLPHDWRNASIELPDFKAEYTNKDNVIRYNVSLSKSAEIELRIPVECKSIDKVLLNGSSVDYVIKPWPGKCLVVVKAPKKNKADVKIEYLPNTNYSSGIHRLECNINSNKTIKLDGIVKALYDPQNVMKYYELTDSVANICFNDNSGNHTIIAEVLNGNVSNYNIIRANINDYEKSKTDSVINMYGVSLNDYFWTPVDISDKFNADITQIYKQKYLTPRNNTVSVRLGVDGYSPWTFPYWNSSPPNIGIENVDSMLLDGFLQVPEGVRFAWNSKESNVSFVSLWDNYPDSIVYNINREGDVACFLVCGSTNIMQCDIANAEIIIYYEDGYKDVIDLIPPKNYWNLSPIIAKPTVAGQLSRAYYDSQIDSFCLPDILPKIVELGKNCNAILLPRKLRSGVEIKDIEFKCLSQEVVVGIMGFSIGVSR